MRALDQDLKTGGRRLKVDHKRRILPRSHSQNFVSTRHNCENGNSARKEVNQSACKSYNAMPHFMSWFPKSFLAIEVNQMQSQHRKQLPQFANIKLFSVLCFFYLAANFVGFEPTCTEIILGPQITILNMCKVSKKLQNPSGLLTA